MQSRVFQIVEAVKYLNYFASIFFLTAMSIDRYIAVVYVVTSSRWRTSRNTFFVRSCSCYVTNAFNAIRLKVFSIRLLYTIFTYFKISPYNFVKR